MAEEIKITLEQKSGSEPIRKCERGPEQPPADEHIERLRRVQAEFDNYRKRTMRQMEQWTDEIRADFCKRLLPALDDIDRALAHSAGDPASLRKGLELIKKNLTATLEAMGLSSLPAAGRSFDPQIHEAVMMETNPLIRGGTVTAEIQRGYLFKEKLLRPVRVKVSADPEEATSGRNGSSADGDEDCDELAAPREESSGWRSIAR